MAAYRWMGPRNEKIDAAACGLLKGLTGLQELYLEQLKAFSGVVKAHNKLHPQQDFCMDNAR